MSWKDDALVHAKDQDPKEAVGLLLNIRGKQKYYPCQNLAITNHQEFILNPEDYVKADNLGDIIGLEFSRYKSYNCVSHEWCIKKAHRVLILHHPDLLNTYMYKRRNETLKHVCLLSYR